MSFEIIPVWRQVTPEIEAELVEFWTRNGALADPAKAALRARQAVCIARDSEGALCAVGTALLRIIPRLRQPTYYYRQFFAESHRGQKLTMPFFERARQVLEEHNASLAQPESLGVLVELENRGLDARYQNAVEPRTGATFIGYSPRGFQLKVIYFAGAKLFAPAPLRRRQAAVSRG